jgi:hypothetical protein
MKRLLTAVLSVLVTAVFAVSVSAAVGTVIYGLKTDKGPNMDEIDGTWGEPAIHVTKDSPNTELVKFWPVHTTPEADAMGRLAIEPEDSQFDLYVLYDSRYLYVAVRSPDEHISGGLIGNPHRGDGIHLWIQVLETMEDPYGPVGQHKGLTESERHRLEDSYLFF